MMSNKEYKIGIDARLWNETGVGRYIRNLVAELQKIDKENGYVLFVRSQDYKNVKCQMSNVKFQIRIADIPWHSIREQLEFPKILEREKLDLVHFPYFSVPIWYKGKYVLTIHDLILHHFPTGKASTHPAFIYWLKHTGYKYIISQAAKNATKILTVSNATKSEIIKHLHVREEKIVTTYEGVDQKISNIKYPISNIQYPYFLYVGNAYPHKNLEMLIRAFQILDTRYKDIRQEEKSSNIKYQISNIKLVLVGKEDYFYRRLEKKVKEMNLENVIIFKHTVSDEELANYYSHALALVAPSLMEGFGLPILEAMEKECLVVASDIPVFHEIAGDIPLYFNPTNVNELSDVLESIAIGRIKNAEERKEKGLLQAKKFSWEKMAKETLSVYNTILLK